MNTVSSTAQRSTTDVENLLLEIWKRTLRISPIFADSNFFDIGGDSLLAVNLFMEIERMTGISLPITVIYDAPTVSELAQLINDQTAPKSSPVVLLKAGTTGDPLFIVHGIGGTVMELAALGQKINIPGPVYAIQARGLDGIDSPLAAIEDMADWYVSAIRQIQPFGPYWLCGYSLGGLVAMEMARRLEAASQVIAALILIDSYAHPSTWPFLSRSKMRLRRAFHLFCDSVRRPDEIFPAVRKRAGAALSGAFSRSDADRHSRESGHLHDWLLDRNPGLPLPLLRVREAGGVALSAYRPQFYAGSITFLKAQQRDIEFPDDPDRIWKPLARQVSFRAASGGHRTIVTEHADSAAACLTDCIHGARRALAPRVQDEAPGSVFGIANDGQLGTQSV